MLPFTYTALPQRVLFGAGMLAEVGAEVVRLGARRALVLATPQQAGSAESLAGRLGDLAAGVFPEAVMHTPLTVTERAVARLRTLGADCVVAIGGGSTTGLSKAIALRTGVPQLVVATTYAGSEVTPILGETQGGKKTTRRTPEVLPETVIYDVDLTLDLPIRMSVASGLNAIAHAAEALYAQARNPITSMMAREAIAALARALPAIVDRPRDIPARTDALYGAWLCGTCLGAVGMALHHKLCHVLGGTFDLPHAETHAVVLPHAIAFNAPACPEAAAAIAAALDADDAGQGLGALARRLGAPRALRDLGMPEAGIAEAAELAMREAYWNPRPVTYEAARDLLTRAWAGEAPQA